MLNKNSAIVPLEGMEQLLSQTDALTLFEVRLKHPLGQSEIALARSRLSGRLGSRWGIPSSLQAAFAFLICCGRSRGRSRWLCWRWLPSPSPLLMAVNERTFEIGVLSALGWSAGRILRLIVIEGVLMSVVGGTIGIILGAIAMEMAARTRFEARLIVPYLSGWSIAQSLIFVLIARPLGARWITSARNSRRRPSPGGGTARRRPVRIDSGT